MICKNCGNELIERFDMLKLEHEYTCPKCKSSNLSYSTLNAAPSPTFTSMNGIEFAKHAAEQQVYVDPEDCIKNIKLDYNPFKDLREEFEQNLLTYKNDKDTLIDILSSTMRLLIRTLEVTHDYNK